MTTEEVCSQLDKMDLQEDVSKENCKNILQTKHSLPQITVQENNKMENSGKNVLEINKNFLQENRTRSTPTSPSFFRSQSVQSRPPRRESPVIRLALFPRLEKCVSEPEVWNDKGQTMEEPGKVQGESACPGSRSEGHISHMSEAGEKTQEEALDAVVDEIDKHSMLSDTSQPPVIGLRPDPPPPLPDEGLIMPRKLPNPCLQSRDHRDLHRELLFNQKVGKNVLNQKSELQRALEKHKESQMKKEMEQQKQETRTPFEKVIEERARRLESLEKNNGEEDPTSNNKPEFLQVHAKLRKRMDSK
ncbi:uncharacterized protein LOC128995277 [Macrosteles quadrilineatus]|uniref:uncharacterized protein LOC128995277 n=1 Tax=Macrosteles quadrilineatus TaxID=74068 RepID=UPI0023E188BF|nr:uncharacterized protein LOC128995277 [Macrosteles quadrilineatus]